MRAPWLDLMDYMFKELSALVSGWRSGITEKKSRFTHLIELKSLDLLAGLGLSLICGGI